MKTNKVQKRPLNGLLLLIALLFSNFLTAQVFIENHPGGNAKDPTIMIWLSDGLQKRIPYENIKGSPFWSDEWKPATLYGETSKELWLCKTKLNLATGEVYYMDNQNNEMVATPGLIKKIVFHKEGDTGITSAVFIYNYQALQLNNQTVNVYLQVLNEGKYQLLKLHNRKVSSADSMFGTLKRYYFSDEIKYFVAQDRKTEPVKKLNKENILAYFPVSSLYSDWVAQNKIDFRKEEQVVAFFNYYNSKN
ncbi:MAG TPA: hypothetical protein PLA68_02180 [Panacibacter sp.]|nr:hypothetical protein [Panacibacter sp.]